MGTEAIKKFLEHTDEFEVRALIRPSEKNRAKVEAYGDALTVEVVKDGPACHTGEESCFHNPVWQSDTLKQFSYEGLYELIKGRKTSPKEGSYTTYLFEKGIDKILKKVGEESTEVIIAGKGGSREETVFEIADLLYHLDVLMVELGITPQDITAELEKRHVVDKKVKQETMR